MVRRHHTGAGVSGMVDEMTALRHAMLLIGIFLCVHHCGPARAQDASGSLAALCPVRQALAPLVEAAAHSARVRPVVLVAMARVESTCDPSAVNRRTQSYGLLQIKLDGSANPDHLEPDELTDPEINVPLGARHLSRWVRLCGSLAGGLTLYHGRKGAFHGKGRCDVDDYARRVLSLVAQVRRWLARQAMRTS